MRTATTPGRDGGTLIGIRWIIRRRRRARALRVMHGLPFGSRPFYSRGRTSWRKGRSSESSSTKFQNPWQCMRHARRGRRLHRHRMWVQRGRESVEREQRTTVGTSVRATRHDITIYRSGIPRHQPSVADCERYVSFRDRSGKRTNVVDGRGTFCTDAKYIGIVLRWYSISTLLMLPPSPALQRSNRARLWPHHQLIAS